MKTKHDDFSCVFEEHFEGVYAYIAFRIAPDTAWAADIAQDVFLAAMEGWNNRRADGSTRAWLRGIAANKVADFFRSRYREAALESAVMHLPTNEGASQQQACLIAATLRNIPRDRAEILEWKYLDGLSVREIAKRSGKSEKSVESALTRARKEFGEVFTRLESLQEADR